MNRSVKTAPVLLIAGLASGQGKTTVTAAIAAAVRQRGHCVQVFKAGPDFIDPMVLARASGQPVYNLDDRMVGLAESRQRVAAAAAAADLVLIEGAMGLYDGPPSAADLARGLGVPVAVLVDAGAMAQTFGAVVHGLASYGGLHGQPLQVLGAIANRVAGPGHGATLADSLPPGLPLLASIPRVDQTLPERHLGLASEDHAAIDAALIRLAQSIDDAMVARLLGLPGWNGQVELAPIVPLAQGGLLSGRHIAVARDPAFRFIYPANLDTLQALGATLCFFSPLADEPVPPQATALWLPGGYPELFAERLSAAQRWTASVRDFAQAGHPVWAECGGLMALCEGLTDAAGQRHAMAGLLPGEVQMQSRLAGLGVQQWALPDTADAPPLRGHTFHYSQFSTVLSPAGHCLSLAGAPGEAVWRQGSVQASYFHTYFSSSPQATAALFGGSAESAV
jgi:cobyrinic acid a,c-diamide synthase